jgi:glycosyltransferase involved in cell wall biosynthesis
MWHLLWHGNQYDFVHTASFPYVTLIAVGIMQRFRRFELVVDWFEVFDRSWWQERLGYVIGSVSAAIERSCARLPQHAFCFSRFHAGRLSTEGLRNKPAILEGRYDGSLEIAVPRKPDPLVVFAGYLTSEKRAPLAVAAFAIAASSIQGLRGEFYGNGPAHQSMLDAIQQYGVADVVSTPGWVDASTLDKGLRSAICLLVTSSRDSLGVIVVEASARATPSLVVSSYENVATERIQDGVNGVVAQSDEPEVIAQAIIAINEAGMSMRESTAAWFHENARRMSLSGSAETVAAWYTKS